MHGFKIGTSKYQSTMLPDYFCFLKKHYFLFLKYGLLSLFFSTNLLAQSNNDKLEISLLTCESGDALYSTFGHSAIRVTDHSNHKDLVFDFGNFDFETPFFAFKFLRGSLDYHLNVVNFSDFQRTYQYAKRGVIEQQFVLNKETKWQLYQQLKRTLKSENRYYKYDFLNDNCTTRIRDIVYKLPILEPPLSSSTTYRKELKTYLSSKKWLALGIDLLLGVPVDKIITQKEVLFLPNQLSEQLSRYQINDQTILKTSTVIVKSSPSTISNSRLLQPLSCFIFAFLIVLFLLVRDATILPKIANLFYFIVGLGGLLLLFLWFGTRHTATQMNYHLLWLNPLFLLLPFLSNGVVKRWLLRIITLTISSLLLFWVFIPQTLNLASLPLILILVLMNLSKKKERIRDGFSI